MDCFQCSQNYFCFFWNTCKLLRWQIPTFQEPLSPFHECLNIFISQMYTLVTVLYLKDVLCRFVGASDLQRKWKKSLSLPGLCWSTLSWTIIKFLSVHLHKSFHRLSSKFSSYLSDYLLQSCHLVRPFSMCCIIMIWHSGGGVFKICFDFYKFSFHLWCGAFKKFQVCRFLHSTYELVVLTPHTFFRSSPAIPSFHIHRD